MNAHEAQLSLTERIRAMGPDMEETWMAAERKLVTKHAERHGFGLDDAAREAGLTGSRGWYDSALYLAKLEFLEAIGA